jgi:hypothetical protein
MTRRRAEQQPQRTVKYCDVLSAAWAADDPSLADRFGSYLKKACAELGRDDWTATMSAAWAEDSDLRAAFGKAVSRGLRKMWADPSARAQQSDRIKQTYANGILRKKRSAERKENWANADYREKMAAVAARKWANPQFSATMSAAAKAAWADPEKRARRLAKIKATRAAP